MSKTILVTGAGGYIGRHIVTRLCDLGAKVIAVSINNKGEIDSRAKILEEDIFAMGDDVFEKLGKPDAMLHLAWRDGFVHNSEAHLEDFYKHYAFVRKMINGGLRQFACMGTMHEIGYHEGAIDENTPCNPMSLYGISKNALRKATELLCQQNNVKFQWLRAYYIYGDDLFNNSIFTKITQAVNEGKTTFPLNSGKNKYDFITVQDLATQISAAVLQDEVLGIINCCSGNPLSLGEMAEDFIKKHGYNITLQYGVFPDRAYDSPAVWGDAEKIKRIMGK